MNITPHPLQARLWQLLCVFALLYSIDSIGTATVSVLIGVDWDMLSASERLVRRCLVAKAWATSMLALITMVVRRAQNHQLPLPLAESDSENKTKGNSS